MAIRPKRSAWRFVVILTAVELVIVGFVVFATYWVNRSGGDVLGIYSDRLRSSLFAGFLSVSGFLLSLKTFVVIKLKEGLYDSPQYRMRHASLAEDHSLGGLYAPLVRLTHLLFASILASFITSASQLTIGLISSWVAAAVCLSLSSVTIVLLVVVLFQIRANLSDWFSCLDEEMRVATAPGKDSDAASLLRRLDGDEPAA